jgi:hypothetical protein
LPAAVPAIQAARSAALCSGLAPFLLTIAKNISIFQFHCLIQNTLCAAVHIPAGYRRNNGGTRCCQYGVINYTGELNGVGVIHGALISDRQASFRTSEKIQRLFTFFVNPNYSTMWQQRGGNNLNLQFACKSFQKIFSYHKI